MNQCKLCKKYKDNCGHHFVDKNGHNKLRLSGRKLL